MYILVNHEVTKIIIFTKTVSSCFRIRKWNLSYWKRKEKTLELVLGEKMKVGFNDYIWKKNRKGKIKLLKYFFVGQKVNVSIHMQIEKPSLLENPLSTNDWISLQKEGEIGEIHILVKSYLSIICNLLSTELQRHC